MPHGFAPRATRLDVPCSIATTSPRSVVVYATCRAESTATPRARLPVAMRDTAPEGAITARPFAPATKTAPPEPTASAVGAPPMPTERTTSLRLPSIVYTNPLSGFDAYTVLVRAFTAKPSGLS